MRAEKDENTQNEKRLVFSGEAIRGMALKSGVQDIREGCSQISSGSWGKRVHLGDEEQGSDDLSALFLEQAEERRMVEQKKLTLEKQRIGIERERANKCYERFQALQRATARRFDLYKKRLELEKN